ncbi:MAG: hypothetical protein ABSH08_09770 [Tepidisphaeraceae bacterium]|jgi:hypothetical protein
MGLFGFRKRSQIQPAEDPVLIELRIPKVNEPAVTPDGLRKQLFDAAAMGDEDKLCSLCQAHEKSIFEQGMIWSNVPAEIRASPVLLRWYANGLKAIARFCAEKLGKPELMDQVRELEALPGHEAVEEPGEANGA